MQGKSVLAHTSQSRADCLSCEFSPLVLPNAFARQDPGFPPALASYSRNVSSSMQAMDSGRGGQ